VSFLWRAVGVAVSGRIDPDSDVFLWVQCVAYAMLAGLVSRMLFLPSGALAESELWIRLIAVAIGLAICFALRRNLLVGVLAGVAAFLVLQYVGG
jgi:branched-subunit amino acid transport protein